ncbi:ABC-2 type transport system permease protein [Breoghania corrubedonensis]|uniref:ABC-2 type transport system permease protein n=2 Tax=Breoghania corrubedonensis TaxID=665038 RepID=A0A2T5VD08_9HYPH|nr:ABC-2 type transport system permease protein [Breoghania corrubedonensis]
MTGDPVPVPQTARRHIRLPGLARLWAMFIKEFLQLRRDRVTFATMIFIPLMQLLLFGFAINTQPKNLPTAVLSQENTDVSRAIVAALKNTSYFSVTRIAGTEQEVDHWLRAGTVQFVVEIPAGFERALRRGETPSLLIAADATDPVASGTALGSLSGVVSHALAGLHGIPKAQTSAPFEIRQHRRYNPASVTRLNIVPGILGTILTMTMLIFTALSVTREIERGTMENLLSMPIRPLEVMLGKIAPYILVGFLQAALIFIAGYLIFDVPVEGSLLLLSGLSMLFITTNLSIGYTFSTLAQNQLQAIQMSFMFFLPNILLSGFMFPFAGMPVWAQWVGEALPLTHYLRIVRGIMLKGSGLTDIAHPAMMLTALTLVAMTIAVTRFRRTLD